MLDHLLHGLGALWRQGDRASGGVIGVAAHLGFQPGVDFGLLAHTQRLKGFAKIALRPHAPQGQCLAVQPVG